jgi:alkylation response protein AidB-like acyl-CoA dehydrogenase
VIGLVGSPEQKKTFLPRFTEASALPSFVAVAEKVAAGDLGSLQTEVAERVTGEKYGVLNAREAPFGIAVGRSGDDLAAAIVESEVRVVRPEDKLGLEAAPTSVVSFDDDCDVIGPGPGLERAVLWTKLLTGALALGCARAAYEYAATYATEREAFGKPIGAFQGISFKIADMAIAVDAARIALWRAAWTLDRGESSVVAVTEAVGQALTAAVRCGDDSVQVLGGHGYIRDHPVEKWFRDAVTLSASDAPEVLGDALIGRDLVAQGLERAR